MRNGCPANKCRQDFFQPCLPDDDGNVPAVTEPRGMPFQGLGVISTLRFCWRPSGVSLVAMGLVSP